MSTHSAAAVGSGGPPVLSGSRSAIPAATTSLRGGRSAAAVLRLMRHLRASFSYLSYSWSLSLLRIVHELALPEDYTLTAWLALFSCRLIPDADVCIPFRSRRLAF